ncbi:DUF883 family protein [Erwinia sp. CPCC 100877]|nr:DUF883 family protein [Erwinia sp. CPCC 100877]
MTGTSTDYLNNPEDDLEQLRETLDEILHASGDPTDQKYIELRERAEQRLHRIRQRLSNASDSYYFRAKKAVCCTDSYIRDNPWCGVGIGAAAGVVLGMLLTRR